MIDFKTKKTRYILVLSIIYILLFPAAIALFTTPSDSVLLHLLYIGVANLRDLINFYRWWAGNFGIEEVFGFVYFSPLILYWYVIPFFRAVGRWINRGK